MNPGVTGGGEARGRGPVPSRLALDSGWTSASSENTFPAAGATLQYVLLFQDTVCYADTLHSGIVYLLPLYADVLSQERLAGRANIALNTYSIANHDGTLPHRGDAHDACVRDAAR